MKISSLLLLLFSEVSSFAQLDYNLMTNWAFHPTKSGTLIDGYNLDIAVVNENLGPSTDILYLESEKEIPQIKIYNASGHLIKLITDKNKKSSISLGEIPIGLYFLKYSSLMVHGPEN